MQRTVYYAVDDELISVTIEREEAGYRVQVGECIYHVQARPGEQGRVDMTIGPQRVRAYVVTGATPAGEQHHVALAGKSWILRRTTPGRRSAQPRGAPDAGTLTATMPGLVLDVLVRPGAQVAKGESLVLLEAMKMELRITAPHAGTVRQVNCQAGEVVARGQKLVEIE